MTNEAKARGWSSVLNSVRTPLGFLTLVALILDGFLLSAASFTERLPLWAPLALLALLVAAVFAVMIIKPLALYHPNDWPKSEPPVFKPLKRVRLRVRGKPRFSESDDYRAVYTVTGESRDSRPPEKEQNAVRDPPYLALELENVYPDDVIRVTIVDVNDPGLMWEIPPFTVWEHLRDAFRRRAIEKWAQPPGAGEISVTKTLEPTAAPEPVVTLERAPAFTSETSSRIASNEPRGGRRAPASG